MKKKFTPRQVQRGEVVYTFDKFIEDLWEDVESTLSEKYANKISDKQKQNGNYEKTLRDVFVFVYELCSLAARNDPKLKMMLAKSGEGITNILQKTLHANTENIALLRAILLREITYSRKQGLSKRQAVKTAVDKSKSVFTNWIK